MMAKVRNAIASASAASTTAAGTPSSFRASHIPVRIGRTSMDALNLELTANPYPIPARNVGRRLLLSALLALQKTVQATQNVIIKSVVAKWDSWICITAKP